MNLLLLAVSAFLLTRVIAYQEQQLPSLQGSSFIQLLLSSGAHTRSFRMTEERHIGPNPELYHPFPDTVGLLQIPPEVLLAVRQYEKSCRERDFEKADAESRTRSLNPSKLLDWHRAVCKKDFSNFGLWLERVPFIHPSGHSYAKLYRKLYAEAVSRGPGDERFYHVAERSTLSPFDQWFTSLSKDEQKQLIGLSRILTLDNEIVVSGEWNGSSREILVFPIAKIRDWLSELVSFEIARVEQSPRCDLKQYGLCFSETRSGTLTWQKRWTQTSLLWLVGTLFVMASVSLFMWRSFNRRREAEQALLFQMISHELRTPMTAMNLSTDGLRTQFDRMDEKGQQHLMKMLDASYDLDKIVSRTLQQLKNENDSRVFNLSEATEAIIEKKYSNLVSFQSQAESLKIRFSDFWYEICLTNLIRNAFVYGSQPVSVTVEKVGQIARVEVRDAGNASLSDLRSFRRIFFRKRSTHGLGIGLRIVHRKLREMGGDLKAYSSPTRFVLEFRCEEEK